MDFSFLALLAAVFAINVIPAFMPPTWSVLAYYYLFYGGDPLLLALCGTLFSTLGRIVLAKWSSPLASRFFSKHMESNAKFMRKEASQHKNAEFFGMFIYALSPLPSNSVFIIAGAAKLRLAQIVAGFMAGRFISYYVILTLTVISAETIRNSFSLGGPESWAIQLVGIALAVLVFAVDWQSILGRKGSSLLKRKKR
ncbi:MAG: hypothetical protein NT051_01880 [Candidatus Micrarchaeota archaeon]|nr:hypothetical protein [Candidatus Micrarchaeota archaeon]